MCQDFSSICQQQIKARDCIRQLEEEVASETQLAEGSRGREHDVHAKRHQKALQQLNEARTLLNKLTFERSQVEQRLNASAAETVLES